MHDSFYSVNPADYVAGFPLHPHRGIETITHLISGKIEHEDSLGNRGIIGPGESQWMTAGVAWGGPIVMNTRQELELAFEELRQGAFVKHKDHVRLDWTRPLNSIKGLI